jgi:hypothetical protein
MAVAGKDPYVFAKAESPQALAIAVSNGPNLLSDSLPRGVIERLAIPLRALEAPVPDLHPTRITILTALQKKRNPRALTPYPFDRGIVKIEGSVKKKALSPYLNPMPMLPMFRHVKVL